MGQVYYGEFSNIDDVIQSFNLDPVEVRNLRILYAFYFWDWGGSAFVLFERGGQLFEVNGSHCSCYGMEDQWEPEATTVEALQMRLSGDSYETSQIKCSCGFVWEINSSVGRAHTAQSFQCATCGQDLEISPSYPVGTKTISLENMCDYHKTSLTGLSDLA